MQFILKHYDTPLLKFSASMDTSEPEIEITWVDGEKKHLLPLDMRPKPDELRRWLFHRTIPKNRAFVHELLAKCGLSLNRPMHIISVCKGLSLNDCYWVVPEGFEPYSEYYASRIAEAMGVSAISYSLSKWKGKLCSTCELFTDKDTAFLPVGYLVRKGGMEAVRAYYKELGPAFVDALEDMLVFDAVICNTDRHYGNFGFLVDNRSNRIIAPAPLFDHGNALFNFAGAGSWENKAALESYVKTLQPCVYDEFIGTAQAILKPRHHKMLRNLLTYRMPRHSKYNLSRKRLRLMEQQVQKQARLLLEV